MRVLTVGSERFTTRPGGLNRYLADLVAALPGVGVDTTTLYPGERFSDSRVPGPLRTVARVAAVTVAAARAVRGCDVVDLHFALYGAGPAVVARLFRVPVVVHFQGPWAEESEIAGAGSAVGRRFKFALERFVYRRADALVVLCEAFGQRLVRDYGIPRDRIRVLAPGVDLERFTPGTGGRAAVPTAVAARRLDPRMGLDIAIAAWARVIAEFPDAQLRIAGQGGSQADLQRQVDELGLGGHVTLEGRVSDDRLLELYRTSHTSLVPTRALEGFGLVALESLATGTPVVVTDVDALPEYIGRFDPSLVVSRDDAPALADRICRLFRGEAPSPEQCVAFAGKFTWAGAAADHAELYRSVTGASSNRRDEHTVALLALEWPTADSAGGGVARHNWRVAHELAEQGHRVVVVTGPGALASDAVEFRHVQGGAGRFARYYAVPVRAARAVRRLRPDAVVAGGDDWALLGTTRSRVYHGTARSEALHSTGLRRWNHQVLRAAEYLSSLDPAARAFSVGPDVPRRRMTVRPLPPVSGVVVTPVAEMAPRADRRGLVFIGPHAGRKRGTVAEDVVAQLAARGHDDPFAVFTARAEDAADWAPGTDVTVAAPDSAIREALARARFLLSTSSYEGFGIPAVEALAAGCLPLATRTPGAEAVLTGPLAALLGPLDPGAFARFAADTVTTLGDDDDAYAALQRAGAARARELLVQGEVRHLVAGGAGRG